MRASTAAICLAAIACATPTLAQQNIRTATSWPGGPHMEYFAKGFADNVALLTVGKVKFETFPAGTIGSPLKVSETVQKKVAPAGHSWSGYDWGIDKTSVLFGGYVGSPGIEAHLHWLYEAGGLQMWREWRLEKFNLVAMTCGSHSDEIHMHSRKPVKTLEDLKGLKLRTTGAWLEIAASLGASTVTLPGGEVYPALERGVVDAIEWATPGINYPLGFHKVAKYIIQPGVHQPAATLECVFDKALWDGFDKPTQALIEAAAKKTTLESWMKLNVEDSAALAKMKAEGLTIINVEPSYIEGVQKATIAWADKTAAAEGGWFAKVLKHQREFVAKWNETKGYRSEFR
jgi:TRAP-type mannitol/chloroaromatic compound transport system substrate-binding protein